MRACNIKQRRTACFDSILMEQACDIIKRGGKQTALKVLWLLRRVYSGNHKKYTLTLRVLMSYIYIYIYMETPFLMFLDHTQRRTTVGRTPLDEWSARRRDLYLTTHDTNNRQISMSPMGFEPKISAGERPLSVVSVVCCQVEVSATSWSLVQRSPTDCAASLCVI